MLTLFKALADQTRLRLIAILDRGEFTVQELVEVLEMGQSRVSRHLKILAEAGVVNVKREGTWAYYRLEPTNELFRQQLPLLRDHFAALDGASEDVCHTTELLAARRQRSQHFFERHARDWDRMVRELLPTPEYHALLMAALENFEQLVEIGVGTGGLLEALSPKAKSIIGIDHSPQMLETARERIASVGVTNVELRLGEMEHLPLASGSSDAVLLHMVLHHAASPESVLREAERVLAPGGSLVVVDLERHRSEWVRERLADQWLGFSAEELTLWCSKAGFNTCSCTPLTGAEGQYGVLLLKAKKT